MEVMEAEGEAAVERELEDLNNSLREVVQDGAAKPKLHCLMMDPCFSMVTVQSEDSGIVWETASSRCSTPWASEIISEPSYALCAPGRAGRILFFMDEELTSRRKRKQKSEKAKTVPRISQEILAGAERPAMVEVSLPNVTAEEEPVQHQTADLKEERHQRLFSLVSEGSEILNIVVPPKVSTVDEEESKGLEDNLYYLEETPAAKSPELSEEPILEVPSEAEKVPLVIPESFVPFPHPQVSRRGATSEDYFEKFTLLDNQATPGEMPAEETRLPAEDEVTEVTDTEPRLDVQPSLGLSAVSMLDISGEQLDDVFYGGGGEPRDHDDPANAQQKGLQGKPVLKESGSALFVSEESVLTPIYLPEGPPKIIDPNLLEEPKALAFLYSDLYADAVGTRKKQDDDDIQSVTSEKSFHSQESDSEDRGYLEKFVLKVEALGTESHETHPEEQQEPFSLTGYMEHHTAAEVRLEEEHEEITDFFRNSASSSPCEPMELLETEEEVEVVRTPRVTFKEQTPNNTEHQIDHQPVADDYDFSEEFLPVEVSEDCPAWEENLPPIIRSPAVKPTSTPTPKVKPVSDHDSIQTPNAIKPVIPPQKSFLDLSPLLPMETEDESTKGEEERASAGSSTEEVRRISSVPPEEKDHADRDPVNLQETNAEVEGPASLTSH